MSLRAEPQIISIVPRFLEEFQSITCNSSLSLSVKRCFLLTFFPSLLTTFKTFLPQNKCIHTCFTFLHSTKILKKKAYKLWRGAKRLSKQLVIAHKGLDFLRRSNNWYRNCYEAKFINGNHLNQKNNSWAIYYLLYCFMIILTIAFRIFIYVFCHRVICKQTHVIELVLYLFPREFSKKFFEIHHQQNYVAKPQRIRFESHFPKAMFLSKKFWEKMQGKGNREKK